MRKSIIDWVFRWKQADKESLWGKSAKNNKPMVIFLWLIFITGSKNGKNLADYNGKNPADYYGGRTPLHFAAWHGHLEICKFIAERIENIFPVTFVGSTPLKMAQLRGHFMIAEYLLSLNSVNNEILSLSKKM